MIRFLSSRSLLLCAVIGVLLVAISARFPGFAAPSNLAAIFDDTSILILLALGQMAVILTRAIDLSVASNMALTGMCVALFNQAFPEASMLFVIGIAIGLGALLGTCNGLAVRLLEVPPIVVTLGTLAIYRGLVYVLSGGTWVTSDKMSEAFTQLPRLQFAGVTVLATLGILSIVTMWIFLRHTTRGRQLYAAGSNPAAAGYLGIDVERKQAFAFVLSGAIAGLCGYLWVSRYAVAYTDVALGFELQVIAACVIGGVSIAGGVGAISGVVLGCLFLGIVKNALPLLGVSPFLQMAISGLVITAAVVLNARGEQRQTQRILEKAST